MFLFGRASQNSGPMNVLFLKFLSIKRRKRLASSSTRKTSKKWRCNCKSAFQYNSNSASPKKWHLTASAVFGALSKKRKISNFIQYCG